MTATKFASQNAKQQRQISLKGSGNGGSLGPSGANTTKYGGMNKQSGQPSQPNSGNLFYPIPTSQNDRYTIEA